jgi:MoaA/NifB/PqqE/SkfB family radical SAM enzyme
MGEGRIPEGRQYFRVLTERVRQPEFQSLFLFVTSRCNARCRTCFYFDKLNSRDDLTFDEIARIAETTPPLRKLWISGGEPFLREELAEILTLFARRTGARNINLPTNGLLPERIFRVMDRVLADCPDVSIDLNFSLDGIGATHDAIRGVPNNFVRTMETIREAGRRYKGIRRLRRNVVSVVTRENYNEIVRLGLHILENTDSDGQYFELMRGQGPDITLKNLTTESVKALHRRLMPIHRRYADRLFAHLAAPVRAIARMYYLGNLRLHFDLHEKCFAHPQKWPMACTAGLTTLVVDHNGRFRACELRGIVGDLADYGYDTQAALASDAMRAETDAIPHANCWCTHSCFIQDSSKFSPRVQLFHIPWMWWKQRWERIESAPLDEIERFRALELN